MKLSFSFSLSKLEDIDDVQVYNYIYLFKFFFGRRAFLTKLKSFFNLGVWTYSFSVRFILRKSDVYNKLFFLLNDLLPVIDKSYIQMGFSILNFFYLVIKDLNVFSEKKTNLGLFYLKNSLDINCFFMVLMRVLIKFY